jgi:hypothetical protein
MTSWIPLLIVALTLAVGGCDLISNVDDATLDEGQRLETVTHADTPTSRAGYAHMGAFIAGTRDVQLFEPGTGPADPPRLVRSFGFPHAGSSPHEAQVDRDGYLWVAIATVNGASLRAAYVIDPHEGTVVRRIQLPDELRAVANLVVGPDHVYLRAWRNGFSGGVGAVDRRCARAAEFCEVRLLTDLGDVGNSPPGTFHLTDGALYASSLPNSRANRESTDRIDVRTGRITSSARVGGMMAFSDEALFIASTVIVNNNTVAHNIIRLDKETLAETARVRLNSNLQGLVAAEGDRLYIGGFDYPEVEIRSAQTLELLDTIDISPVRGSSLAFGFVAPGVLLLGAQAYLDVRSGEVVADAFPIEGGDFALGLHLPEGHPLAR